MNKLNSTLFALLAKDSEFVWSKSCQDAIDTLKDKLTTAPILRGSNWTLPFHIHVDASHKAIGEVLGHLDDKLPYAIYIMSKNMSMAELSYTMTENELMVVMHSLNKFRHYITGYQTFGHIDHVPIKYLMNKRYVNA